MFTGKTSLATLTLVFALIAGTASILSIRMTEQRSGPHDRTADAVQPVNDIVGDAGYAAAFGRMPDARSSERVRIATHLEYVERLLRARPTDHLTDVQARRRLAALDLLRSYRMRGEFPQNTTHVGRRTPVFIDGNGRICAVGYLIEQTSGRSAAEAINERFQFARISEIDAPVLPEWAEQHGFTLRELGMIQPAYCWREPTPAGCIVEDESVQIIEIASIGLNASSALLNGWMAARSDRNVYVAGSGLLLGGAGLAVGFSGSADYRAATLATAGVSILLSGWNLLRPERSEPDQPGDQVAAGVDIAPTWMVSAGSNQPGLRVNWRF